MSAPVHLTSLFANHFKSKPEAAIINVTGGLAFVPAPMVATYSATKAFVHSFTVCDGITTALPHTAIAKG